MDEMIDISLELNCQGQRIFLRDMKTLDVQRYKLCISAKERAGRPKAMADGAKKNYKRTEKAGRVANYME
ncbi:MAG: hypothetical protein J6V96_03315 [Aeriscardovia sp.]|nr:hypothetical protein [Aeriscardovia sp.]